ncbi:MAG: histidine kinase [Rhodocyclaceae bacterium]
MFEFKEDKPQVLPSSRRLLIVLIGNTLIAAMLWATGNKRPFLDLWLLTESIGLSICFVFTAVHHLTRERFGLLPALVLGTLVGFPAGAWLVQWLGVGWATTEVLHSSGALFRYGIIGFICTAAFSYFFQSRLRIFSLDQARREAELREAQGQKAALLAELRLLQAQIEPHFLFNTLANLHSLIGRDDAAARQLLERLNDYLRASLVHSRARQATLGDEADMLSAYLDIQAQRMGGRLQTRIAIDDSLRGLAFPPMLLQPLVENAIVHGIEPKLGEGRISVEVLREGEGESEGLRVVIADDGVGFGKAASSGQGVGLANVRERLAALYGAAARLDIKDNAPQGARVELCLPLDASAH